MLRRQKQDQRWDRSAVPFVLAPLHDAYCRVQRETELTPFAVQRSAAVGLFLRALSEGRLTAYYLEKQGPTRVPADCWHALQASKRSNEELGLRLSTRCPAQLLLPLTGSGEDGEPSGPLYLEDAELTKWLMSAERMRSRQVLSRIESEAWEILTQKVEAGEITLETGREASRGIVLTQLQQEYGKQQLLPARMWRRTWKQLTAQAPEYGRPGRKRRVSRFVS